jgi:molybdenum cofactor synthesis domain-containing protein
VSRIRAAVLTISDRCSRGESEDRSGPAVAALCRERLDADVVETAVVPDKASRIARKVGAWSQPARRIDLALTTGGTGLAPRDITPEALSPLIERHHPALLELARLRCLPKTPLAFLSRGVAGAIGRTLVITLPGSPRGATEMLDAICDILPHAIDILRGEGSDAHAAMKAKQR